VDNGLALDEHEAVALERQLVLDGTRVGDLDLVRPVRPLRLRAIGRIEDDLLAGRAEVHAADDGRLRVLLCRLPGHSKLLGAEATSILQHAFAARACRAHCGIPQWRSRRTWDCRDRRAWHGSR